MKKYTAPDFDVTAFEFEDAIAGIVIGSSGSGGFVDWSDIVGKSDDWYR